MPKAHNDGKTTHTRQLSGKIDTAFETYKANPEEGERALHEAFLAQAKNIFWNHLRAERDNLEANNLPIEIAGRALQALSTFRGQSKLSTWFYALAQNEVKGCIRALKKQLEQHIPVEAVQGRGGDDDTEEDGNRRPRACLAAEPANQDASLDIERLKQELPPKQAEVWALRHQEGYTFAEIARKTGAPPGTVASRFRLAKEHFSKKMGPKSDKK